MIANDFLRLED